MPNDVSVAQARGLLSRADRVLVIGCSGGGKSTLAAAIARSLDVPHLSYDREVLWLPGWVLRDKAEQRRIAADLARGERWVMCGTATSTFDLRLPRADLVVWLRVGRLAALSGVARRVLTNYGRVRPDMAPGCPEKLPDWAFLRYIWTFERAVSPRIVALLDRHAPSTPVVTLTARRHARALLGG